MGSSGANEVEAGFAKLQDEDFEYYMQTYSIILGRNSKKSTVDLDLASLGCGGMNISRHHARIFYDFQRRRVALEELGKNVCFVEGILHLPGDDLIKLDSQDLLQIGDKEFYFLLPARSILGGSIGPRHHVNVNYAAARPGPDQLLLPAPSTSGGKGKGKKATPPRRMEYFVEEFDSDDEAGSAAGGGSKKVWPGEDGADSGGYGYGSGSSSGKAPASGQFR